MKGVQILTDKNHEFTKLDVFISENVLRAERLEISETFSSGFNGFGVAITESSCHQLMLMDKNERTAFLQSIYSKSGLNLSVARLSIGASDYSARLYTYDDVPFDTGLKHFSIDKDREYIIPVIKEILKIRPDICFFASPWSPPGWMKTGGEICGGYMREEFVECYADYFIKYIKAYADEGIKISAVTPQNEPNSQQGGNMPACIWHPETEAEFIKVLKKKLNKNNLDTKIWMFDHNFSDANRVLWLLDNIGNLKESTDGIAFHYYAGSIEETFEIKEKYPDIELHFTEGGPRLYDNYDCDFCKWGIMISKALNAGCKSFTGWNLMLNELGGPNIGPFFCGGLVTRDSVSGELKYSGQYKAIKHIAPHINKNTKIYKIRNNIGQEMFSYPAYKKEIHGFLIDNNNGKTVLVLINPDDAKRQTQINIKNTNCYIELSPESISTIIM